ncbi:uncharacterized protein LOC119769157 [Culex quinquefasciatus]|uniref:uncharacterized protein LOC119769157 n=1 Tax=Culex quinquefasciatus TaxID=7176 RepID=UPI0018E32E5E|nr:uncharacterized protein LOC119769157 [Culex quinquefasciatus]
MILTTYTLYTHLSIRSDLPLDCAPLQLIIFGSSSRPHQLQQKRAQKAKISLGSPTDKQRRTSAAPQEKQTTGQGSEGERKPAKPAARPLVDETNLATITPKDRNFGTNRHCRPSGKKKSSSSTIASVTDKKQKPRRK